MNKAMFDAAIAPLLMEMARIGGMDAFRAACKDKLGRPHKAAMTLVVLLQVNDRGCDGVHAGDAHVGDTEEINWVRYWEIQLDRIAQVERLGLLDFLRSV